MQNNNSPFSNKILVETVETNFRLLHLPKYDGTKDPQEYVLACKLVMNLHEQPNSKNAKLSVTTLTGKHGSGVLVSRLGQLIRITN